MRKHSVRFPGLKHINPRLLTYSISWDTFHIRFKIRRILQLCIGFYRYQFKWLSVFWAFTFDQHLIWWRRWRVSPTSSWCTCLFLPLIWCLGVYCCYFPSWALNISKLHIFCGNILILFFFWTQVKCPCFFVSLVVEYIVLILELFWPFFPLRYLPSSVYTWSYPQKPRSGHPYYLQRFSLFKSLQPFFLYTLCLSPVFLTLQFILSF